MAENINRVLLTGNLTRDPETKELQSGATLANLRIAVNGRVKRGGEWVDKANFFDVACFGSQAKYAGYLSKGSAIALDGRLDYQEWETEGGDRRSRVLIIANVIQGTDKREGGGQRSGAPDPEPTVAESGPPPLDPDEDIPF